MKLFHFFLITIFLYNCSFDNKSGLWKNEGDKVSKKEENVFKEFKKFSSSKKTFDEIITLKKNFKFKKKSPINNNEWTDIFYSKNNNLDNFKFDDNNLSETISKKITRNKLNKYLLLKNRNIIMSDEKGTIYIYSLNEKKLNNNFNFYKKKYKKIKKKLNLVIDLETIFVSDNLGYVYAYDYTKKKVLWAKNYKIPFRSNLKITNNKLIASNQNNDLFFLNKEDGNIIKLIPSEDSVIKNKFINSLSLDEESLFFLNSFGSLYSIDINELDIDWFINLNQSVDLNPSNIFLANQIVSKKGMVIVSTSDNTYFINNKNGSILYKKNFSSNIKPIIYNEHVFFITKNNLLLSMNLINGKIIYSYNINKMISNYTKKKKQNINFKNFMILNNEIFIFLESSDVLTFDLRGNLKKVTKFSSAANTDLILANNSIFYLDKKNKLIKVN